MAKENCFGPGGLQGGANRSVTHIHIHIQPPTPDQIFASYVRLSAGMDDDLRQIGRRIVMHRLKTVKGFNLRALHRLIETLRSRFEDPELQ